MQRFDLRRPDVGYVNIQHPGSGVDRLIEISGTPHFAIRSRRLSGCSTHAAERGDERPQRGADLCGRVLLHVMDARYRNFLLIRP